MSNFVGLDVSSKTTFICIVNEKGVIVFQDSTVTEPDVIYQALVSTELAIDSIGIESGSMSHWLTAELQSRGLPVVCIDSRKMSKILSIGINKTDKNDARFIAEALRCGFYTKIIQKTQQLAELNVLIQTRRTLVETLVKLKNTIRGHLKIYGLRLGNCKHNKFSELVKKHLSDKSDIIQFSLNALLLAYEGVLAQLSAIEDKVKDIGKDDEDVKLLSTIPGVGLITALTFKIHIGDPTRFKNSRSVGAFLGMTPREYSSGETTRKGKISKCGPQELRFVLNDAATSMMYCTKSWNRIKAWGLKLLKKKGHKKTVMAVGRKMATVMHRMLITRKPFEYGEPTVKETKELAKAI